MGAYADEEDYLIQNVQIQNEFEKGKTCGEAYKRVYEANRRLCERLGVDEDPDVETIICGMFNIIRIVSEKMSAYGAKLSAAKITKQ